LWQCSNTACTNLDKTARERTITGRKAVSDFFGRNKNSTKSIPDDVWGWLCRTCYQRGRYRATARAGVQPHEEANWYLMLIRDQVKCLKIWRPEATFTIQLQAAAEQRYREYCVALERLGGDRAVAEASVTRPGRQSRKKDQLIEDRGQTLRMSHAKYIKENLTGANTSYADIESVLDWMQGEVDDGQMLHLAAIEFLIHPQRDDE
ncbi:uncharacterized protein K489DRAFT_305506, partial [Dissoconium aciculare CBS 342.82]|uniref:Uncharacterized protein n=1 Tax=Dissoconium aciculare CBS 342.82 TaxID=1314786 RepID=A0A6J3MEX8_9PEZI